MTSPMFDGTYDPTVDPTVDDWSGNGRTGGSYDRAERALQDGIDKSGDTPAFASVRTPAWHKLGVTFDHQVTAEELLLAAGADYPVFKAPLTTTVTLDPGTMGSWGVVGPEGKTLTATVPGKMATYRLHPSTGEIQALGVVSEKYPVVTNREAFLGFGDALINLATPSVATCAVLYEGRRAFMCWKLPQGMMIGGVDSVELWLLVETSHDGSRPLTAAVTPIRAVCQNTVRYGLRNAKARWSIRHTRNMNLAVKDAQASLGLVQDYADQFTAMAEHLLSTPMTNAVFAAIIDKEFGPGDDAGKKAEANWDEKRTKLVHLFATADTQANVRGTAWAGVQAVGEYCDWGTQVQVKGWDADGYRFWRSLDGEVTITRPKLAALAAIGRYAGVDSKVLATTG